MIRKDVDRIRGALEGTAVDGHGKMRSLTLYFPLKHTTFSHSVRRSHDPKKLPPVHPGEFLLEEFVEPMGISQYRLVKDISVPPRCIDKIVHGQRGITAKTPATLPPLQKSTVLTLPT